MHFSDDDYVTTMRDMEDEREADRRSEYYPLEEPVRSQYKGWRCHSCWHDNLDMERRTCAKCWAGRRK